MKRILPLLAALTFVFGALPMFADEPNIDESLAQVPSGAIAQVAGAGASCNQALKLTDAQVESLQALKNKYFADRTMKIASVKILKNDLRNEMTKETIDKNAVLAIQAKINAAHADLSNARISQMIEASQIFTPEQRKAIHSKMLRHQLRGTIGHGGKRHGKCGPGFGSKFPGRGGRPAGGAGPGAGAEAPSDMRDASFEGTEPSAPNVEI